MLEGQGVTTSLVRAVDLDIATGVWPDMTEHGWASDACPIASSCSCPRGNS